MKTMIPWLLVALAAALPGCDRRAPDNMNPKTSAQSSGSLSGQPSGQAANDARTGTSK